MSSPKRSCSSCTFFQDAPLQGYGWCTHPKRQLTTEVRILVRKGELACRNPWGNDQWESKVPGADSGTRAGQPPPDRLIAGAGATASADDQVTSVTTSLSLQSPSPESTGERGRISAHRTVPDDVIVSQPAMLPEDGPPASAEPAVETAADRQERDDLNLPAHEDQQERVRVIARGNRDAILKARERMVLRRGGSGRAAVAPPNRGDGSEDIEASHSGDESRDDAQDVDRFRDDSLLPVARRFGRRYQGHHAGPDTRSRGYADPAPPVPADEVNGRLWQSPQVTRSSDAARFESVPEIKPDLALPQLRSFLQANGSGSDTADGTDGGAGTDQPETSYDRVLRRAQAIQTASQKERSSRLIRNRANAGFAAPQPVASGAAVSTATGERTATAVRPTTTQFRTEVDAQPVEGETQHFHHAEDEWDAEWDDTPPVTAGAPDTQYDEAPFLDDAVYPRYDDDDDADPVPRVEPQHSWWRGLSLGFRRRAEPEWFEVDGADAFDDGNAWLDLDDDDAAPEVWPADDDLADDEVPAGSRGRERVFSFASEQGMQVRPSVSLRDSRAAEEELIDYELTDEVLETSFADDTDRIQAESWREDNQQFSDRAIASADRTRRDVAFALSDPGEMDAFRAALFGPVSNDTAPPVNTRPERPTSRRAPEPSRVPREDIPASSRELPARGDRPSRVQHRYLEEMEFDIRDFVEQDEELLDMRVQIAPDIPRACQTCRNFRPSESGERGWCTNDFAFTHRQMVNADDLPCQSSIGCWWLPSDESWMPEEALAFRDSPTPLTDQLVARRHGRGASEDHRDTALYVREM